MAVEQAGKIWQITGIKSFKGEGGNFKLDASVDGQPVRFLQNGGTRISILFACSNTCEGILSALETRNMFSRNAIQNRICIISSQFGSKSVSVHVYTITDIFRGYFFYTLSQFISQSQCCSL